METRDVFRWLLAAAYLVAGIAHLATPGTFLPIMPDWVPFPLQVILVTGVCELAGAAGLLLPPVRRAAGIALALYAVCVFPANIKHALDGAAIAGMQLGWWYHVPRLLLQPVLVWWALYAGDVVTWPLRRAARA
jgi:uncharacterized membrane protein